ISPNGTIIAPMGITALACSTTKPASGCAISSQPTAISTNPLLASVVLGTGEEDRITVKAETKTTLAEISFNEANTCAFNGLEPVKGAVTLGAPTGQLESSLQAITGLGSAENNSLEVAN